MKSDEQRGKLPPGPEAQFRAFLAKGEIKLQRCSQCNAFIHYPRSVCPSCHSADYEWVTSEGNGEVYSCTCVFRKPEKGGSYNVSIIELEEGVRLIATVGEIDPEAVYIGMKVGSRIETGADGPFLVFVPCEGMAA